MRSTNKTLWIALVVTGCGLAVCIGLPLLAAVSFRFLATPRPMASVATTATTATTAFSLSGDEQQLCDAINSVRAAQQTPKVTPDATLCTRARDLSAASAKGQMPAMRGNYVFLYTSADNVQEAFNAFLRSSRSDMLRAEVKSIGIGVARAADGAVHCYVIFPK